MTSKPDAAEPLPSSDLGPLVNLPGIHELREAVENTRCRMPGRATVRQDAIAGLTVAIASVPDGMAGGLLAGVNPIYGLYASMVGPIVGGALASTRLMVITSTSAASLVAGQALIGITSGDRDSALFLMVVLAGAFAIAFGFLGLGRMTRFVSYSVMTGFLTGIAVVLILSQLPTVVGYAGEGANRIAQTFDLLRRLDEISFVSLLLSVLTVVLIVLLQRTRLRSFASLVAIAVPTVLVALFGLANVPIVADIGTIPRGIPIPTLPAFADTLEVITGALSLAVIVLVQGAGVSQSVPNPDGSRSRASRDFIAQGAANIASGLFRGLPVGGSLGATALNVVSGATRRWAAVFAGLWMAVIVVGLPGLVAHVAMPALAALLIVAGIKSIKPVDVTSVWRAGWPSRLAGATTFVTTLVLPIQAAVSLGVAISMLLYVNWSSTDVTVVELVAGPDGRIRERKPPERLPPGSVTVLDIYGHLFYAGVRTLERLLPRPERGAEHPVVVLRLRGRSGLGATLEEVLSNYAEQLASVHGRLYLSGLSKQAHREVTAMAKLSLSGPVRAYEVTPILGESTRQARADAEAWLVGTKQKN
jgi:SulP family sulfate permease